MSVYPYQCRYVRNPNSDLDTNTLNTNVILRRFLKPNPDFPSHRKLGPGACEANGFPVSVHRKWKSGLLFNFYCVSRGKCEQLPLVPIPRIGQFSLSVYLAPISGCLVFFRSLNQNLIWWITEISPPLIEQWRFILNLSSMCIENTHRNRIYLRL